MDKDFKIFDVSGDVGLRVYGGTLEELFTNGAKGLFSLITNLSSLDAKKSINVKVFSESLDGLFVSWLNELIFQFDTYGFTGRDVEVEMVNENGIEATVWGEEFDRSEERRVGKECRSRWSPDH